MRRKILPLVLALGMIFALNGCGNDSSVADVSAQLTNDNEVEQIQESQGASEPKPETNATDNAEKTSDKTLVIYFSCTGTTKDVAEMISENTGGELFEIVPVQAYTENDLNYNDKNSRTSIEQNDSSVRPEISSQIENWDDYSVIYLGHPIWWGEEPRIMDTFVESYDFTGKTVIPFCTSGSSGVGKSADNLASLAQGNGNWLSGTRFGSGATKEEISDWISGLEVD